MRELNVLQNELENVKMDLARVGKLWCNETDKTLKNEYDKQYFELCDKERALEKEITTTTNYNVKVGDGMTLRLYSDCEAYTIIKRTAKTITIQRDKATLNKNFKPKYTQGGFSCHCENQEEQTYEYERNENGNTYTLRWSDKLGKWNAPKGFRSAFLGRHEFYDYNF